MKTAVIFNSEMKKYLISDKSEITEFINKKFKESKYETYYGFFDDFLFNYGITSFNFIPFEVGNKYIPYLNCDENNIFREKKGFTDLSSKPCSLSECHKIFAEYFISKFRFIKLETLSDWKS